MLTVKNYNELQELLMKTQDRLVPRSDNYKEAIYHYLFRHTYLIGKEGHSIYH